jgi:hypothetical protein
MTKSQRIREVLGKAPATTSEISALTGWSKRDAHIAVWMLSYSGQAESLSSIPSEVKRGRRHLKLWTLTRRGEYLRKWARRSKP